MKQPSFWQQISQYLFLKKREPDAPHNLNIKFMHGMNRISIFMFLAALILLIIKLFFRS
ncbi:MAG: DUF6728 family protein [Chitinophagaceae bacterium]